MSVQPAGKYILGTTHSGKSFRPSDWAERLASNFSSFEHGRLSYHAHINPVRVNGQKALFLANKLADENPTAWQFLVDFAESNQLLVMSIEQPEPLLPVTEPLLARIA